ncbi:sigma-70 family RNA polymerase sigma factor [Rubinisphaera sp.]|uniref:sigma-70 family RNA polymerase sigma factor n=1 Tax=Rubinisphaera sp. TaxID=2024857 RepID=UPI000C0D3A23|nr:sigma-70 family RNA polymerase sigma factor [Rubinisphaera sp.]MBV10026.1 hypothetical protein [Rubinisphaera sp.]HCS51550.1 hypothetical protein [Planctomycetaceae bacterium]|tara:strand:- start:2447 stop:3058 length:612 start_codon:yes stop_codon:yes gene_type:complete
MTNNKDGRNEFEELLVRTRQGDELARSALLQHLRDVLRPIVEQELGQRLRVRADESDLLQKVLIQVTKDFPQFQGETSSEFVGWVRKILENDIKELLQKEKYTAKRSIDREQDASHEIRQAPGVQTSPSRRMIRSEHTQIVREAIDQLDDEVRVVMRMKFLEDLSMADIARKLDKSESAVARFLVKGMRQLKILLTQRGISDF